jgi:hypothetical protein
MSNSDDFDRELRGCIDCDCLWETSRGAARGQPFVFGGRTFEEELCDFECPTCKRTLRMPAVLVNLWEDLMDVMGPLSNIAGESKPSLEAVATLLREAADRLGHLDVTTLPEAPATYLADKREYIIGWLEQIGAFDPDEDDRDFFVSDLETQMTSFPLKLQGEWPSILTGEGEFALGGCDNEDED